TAIPVRSACFGAVFGVLGVVGVVVFAASLETLATTPRQYGRAWDFIVRDQGFDPLRPMCDTHTVGLAGDKRDVATVGGIGALAAVCDNDNQLSGRPVTIFGETQIRGAIEPSFIEGRAPRNATEVALGRGTMRALHVDLGDTVTGRTPTGTAVR